MKTFDKVEKLMYYLDELEDGLDLVELCGGEGRTSTIAIRRHFSVGENFDLVTSWNLNDPSDQEHVLRYFKKYRPLVAIMGPTCKPFGKLANYNYWHNYEAWLKSYHEAAPHGRFCGEIALLQDSRHRYFVCENPKDSWLFAEAPWPDVMERPTTVQVIVDQCTMGLKTKEGLPAKKPTVLVSNSELLLRPFQSMRCKGNHEHGLLVGGRAAAAQVWPWNFANHMIEGILLLKHHLDHVWIVNAFPSIGSGPGDPDAPVPERYKWKCNACRNNLSKHDARHTRVPGECGRHAIKAVEYKCPGCKAFKPATHGSYTYDPDECKWAVTMARRSHTRKGRPPRQGRTPAVDDETKDAQAQDFEDMELGQMDEEAFPEPVVGGSSSSTAVPKGNLEIAEEDQGEDQPQVPNVQTRAPHTRHRKKFMDASEGTEKRSDWSRFDIGSVLRVHQTAKNRATLQRAVRKLHLRWWHAGKTAMTRILDAAGLPKDVLELVPDIVDTCKECRKWQRPGKETIATVGVSTQFNEHVEIDLMFYRKYIVCHFIDRASRWRAAKMIENKEDTTLVEHS